MRILGYLMFFACAVVSFGVHAQQNQALTIISPASSTVVHPEQVVSVIVQGSAQIAGAKEGIIGQVPLGASDVQNATQKAIFTLNIPASISPGSYSVTAVETLPDGTVIQSSPIFMIVTETGSATALIVKNRQMFLSGVGRQGELNVLETKNGKTHIADNQVSFTSLSPEIATVDLNGVVTARSVGTTQISISSDNITVMATVKVTGTAIVGDLNGDDQVDINDMKILESALNTAANGPNDPRDLNHDGKIDALDIKILSTLCTYPNCATHP